MGATCRRWSRKSATPSKRTCARIGLIEDETLDEAQRRFVEEKREQHERTGAVGEALGSRIPDGAQFCMKCQTQAVVRRDGCMICLNCGDSKCG